MVTQLPGAVFRHEEILLRKKNSGCFLFLLVLYLLVALAGLIPVNNDFEPTADGVEIIVTLTYASRTPDSSRPTCDPELVGLAP
jgi:hypothetical protein